MTTFEVSLVARTPSASGAPALAEVDRLVVDTISYTEELNAPGTATVSCPVRALTADAKTRLADLAAHPCEIWIHQDASIVWAGEIQTIQVQGQTANLNCVGLLGYTFRMTVGSDITYAAEDQFSIVTDLIDRWQLGLPGFYANYGIDTSTVGTSGVVRDRQYFRGELATVGQRITELSAVVNGFDMRVDPITRKLILSHPIQGTDLTSTIILDDRNIDSASIIQSVAPQDFCSYAVGSGTSQADDGTGTALYTTWYTPGVTASFGLSTLGQNFDGVSDLGTLDNHTQAFLSSRDQQFFQPGVTIMPRPGAQIGSFHPGDTIAYAYDAGFGLQSGNYRVSRLTVSVAADGAQRIAVEFV